jgi:hypothetical protein
MFRTSSVEKFEKVEEQMEELLDDRFLQNN